MDSIDLIFTFRDKYHDDFKYVQMRREHDLWMQSDNVNVKDTA
jgi:hypothetical protein